jgi:hypothetical protein
MPQPLPAAACHGECGCSNLGGAWLGACSVNGKEQAQPAHLDIDQQSCHHITINKDHLAIGGLKTYTLAIAADLCAADADCLVNGPSTEGGESVADWNKDHNVLTVQAHSGSRLLDRATKTRQLSGSLRLDGAHLLVDATGTGADGAAVKVSCSFEK